MRAERRTLAARAVPFLLLASTAAKSVKPIVKKEPPPVLNPFFESLLKWWCEAMDNEADSRCNLLFTNRHISQTSDGTQIRGLSAQMRRYVPMTGAAQRDQFEQLAAEFCKTAGSKCPLGSAPARLLRLLRARLAAMGSSALPGRGRPTGHQATASGVRASRLQSCRFRRL